MKKVIIEKIVVGPMETNCYIFGCGSSKEGIIIDPGFDCDTIKTAVDRAGLKISSIVNTHGHVDHIGCNHEFDLPVLIHQADRAFLIDPQRNLSSMFGAGYVYKNKTHVLRDNDEIAVGELKLKVLHTPGHTPGSICLLGEKIVFTGDTLFMQGIGRTDFPYGSDIQIADSIKNKLFTLAAKTTLYPGHGPSSTIEAEKINNPYVE